jgi:signal transduction histidine kinase
MWGNVQTSNLLRFTLLNILAFWRCGVLLHRLGTRASVVFSMRVRLCGQEGWIMYGEAIDAAVAAVAHCDSIAPLLLLASEIGGSDAALLARVSDNAWTVCARHKASAVGADADYQLPLGRPVLVRLGLKGLPISIVFPGQQSCETLTASSIACGVAAPIVLANGRFFGVLCALDPTSLNRIDDGVESKFKCLSSIIASQINQYELRDQEKAAFLDEKSAGLLREQFIAILGHDLRNPLHAIFASSDLLVRQLIYPAHAQIAGRIKTNARRMALLIDDVLDFARGRLGGGISVELTEVENIETGLTTVIQELEDSQTHCMIRSDFHVTRSVRCDLGRLQQVASNLLGNALTHGEPHQPIKFSAKTDEHDLVLEVWNSGAPIPAESLSRIFEPFWRHSVSASRNGLGLGLHICSQIVQAHQGRISVTSTREDGTRFTARLPLSSGFPSTSILPVVATASHPSVSASISAQL